MEIRRSGGRSIAGGIQWDCLCALNSPRAFSIAAPRAARDLIFRRIVAVDGFDAGPRSLDLVPDFNAGGVALDAQVQQLTLQASDPGCQCVDLGEVRSKGVWHRKAELQRRIDQFPGGQQGFGLFQGVGWIEFLSHGVDVFDRGEGEGNRGQGVG